MDTKSIESQDLDIIESAFVALREVWKKRLLVFLITIAGLFASIIVAAAIGNETRYTSSATLFSAVYGSYNDTAEGVAVMNRYANLVYTSRVCNRAAQALAGYNLSAEDLQQMVQRGDVVISGAGGTTNSYSYVLTLNTHVDSANLAIPLANVMASAFATELNELIGADVIQVLDEATTYSSYETTNSLIYILLITAGAFVMACGMIFVLAFFSPWVRSAVQCEQNPDLILGMLPYTKDRK